MSEYGSERFRVRLRRLSEYDSVAYLVERPTRETRAEQYSDAALFLLSARSLLLTADWFGLDLRLGKSKYLTPP